MGSTPITLEKHAMHHRATSIHTLALLLITGFVTAGCNSSAPVTGGITKGKVGDCPAKDNCVSTSASQADKKISLLAFSGDKAAATTKIKAVLAARKDAKIVADQNDYLHVEFTTPIMHFVDDAEFLVTGQGIQMRSASRVGYSDFGKNRSRLEGIRTAFEPCCK